MNRAPIVSSNVESIGYAEDDQTLEIEFKNGAVYQYFDVPESIYLALRDADSVGGYLAAHIKGVFRYSRV